MSLLESVVFSTRRYGRYNFLICLSYSYNTPWRRVSLFGIIRDLYKYIYFNSFDMLLHLRAELLIIIVTTSLQNKNGQYKKYDSPGILLYPYRLYCPVFVSLAEHQTQEIIRSTRNHTSAPF